MQYVPSTPSVTNFIVEAICDSFATKVLDTLGMFLSSPRCSFSYVSDVNSDTLHKTYFDLI